MVFSESSEKQKRFLSYVVGRTNLLNVTEVKNEYPFIRNQALLSFISFKFPPTKYETLIIIHQLIVITRSENYSHYCEN